MILLHEIINVRREREREEGRERETEREREREREANGHAKDLIHNGDMWLD